MGQPVAQTRHRHAAALHQVGDLSCSSSRPRRDDLRTGRLERTPCPRRAQARSAPHERAQLLVGSEQRLAGRDVLVYPGKGGGPVGNMDQPLPERQVRAQHKVLRVARGQLRTPGAPSRLMVRR